MQNETLNGPQVPGSLEDYLAVWAKFGQSRGSICVPNFHHGSNAHVPLRSDVNDVTDVLLIETNSLSTVFLPFFESHSPTIAIAALEGLLVWQSLLDWKSRPSGMKGSKSRLIQVLPLNRLRSILLGLTSLFYERPKRLPVSEMLGSFSPFHTLTPSQRNKSYDSL